MQSEFVLLATGYGWEHTAIWSRQCPRQEWGQKLLNRFADTRARLHSLATLLGDFFVGRHAQELLPQRPRCPRECGLPLQHRPSRHVEANDLLNKWTTGQV